MQHSTKFRVKVAGVALTAVLAGAGTVGVASATSVFGFAKHGADKVQPEDAAGHARKGADNPAGHARKGADNPAGHARKGADNPAGHARRGADDNHVEDAPNHG
jgi:hypothetical protein